MDFLFQYKPLVLVAFFGEYDLMRIGVCLTTDIFLCGAVIVHAPEKVDGKRVQKVDIVFNFVGEINFLSATEPKRQGAWELEKAVQPL